MLLRSIGPSPIRRRRAAPAVDRLPAPALGGYAIEAVRFAARAWTMKAEEEHRSAAVFADALSYLVDSGAPLDLLRGLHAVVGDELGHAALCLDLARRMETDPPRVSPLPRDEAPLAPAERRARGIRILLVEGAIGETISSALFNAGRRAAGEPCTRAALGRILRDEVLHARFFREAIAALRPELDAPDWASLAEVARSALGALETAQMLPVLKRLEQGAPFDPEWGALGVIPPEARVEAFYGAIERRVVPWLDQVGLDGAAAWRDRHRAAR